MASVQEPDAALALAGIATGCPAEMPFGGLGLPVKDTIGGECQTPGGGVMAFTRYSFVYPGIVHWSMLFLAFNTSCIATPTPLIVETNIAQCIWCSPCPPVVSFNIKD